MGSISTPQTITGNFLLPTPHTATEDQRLFPPLIDGFTVTCVQLGECVSSGNIISQVVVTWCTVKVFEVLFSEEILPLTEDCQVPLRRRLLVLSSLYKVLPYPMDHLGRKSTEFMV